MDFWNTRQHRYDETPQNGKASDPSFLDKLTEYAKEEAMATVVETLTGGWITMEYEDAEEPRARGGDRQKGNFEDRLQRRLAELEAQPAARETSPADYSSQSALPVQTVPAPTGVVSPIPHRSQGFGRKML